jgi:NADH-quinone oxidoreductase subunit A
MLIQYIPIFLVFGFAIVFAVVTVYSSKLFGPQRANSEKLSTYESGMKPIGTTHDRVSVKYYLVTMLFIIFDIEVIFIYPWAVQFKSLYRQYGIFPFVTMLIFLVIFEIGFLYMWKKGGFKWD